MMQTPDHPPNGVTNEPNGKTFSALPLLLILLGAIVLISLALRRGVINLSSDASKHRAVGKPLTIGQLTPLVIAHDQLDPSDCEGKVVLVHFWGTWCGPCLMEYPELVELYRKHRSDERFLFAPISCPGYPGHTIENLRSDTDAFYSKAGFRVPTYADTSGQTMSSVLAALEQDGMMFPTTVILDRKGMIRGVWQGYHRLGVVEMDRMINDLLAAGDSV